MVDALQFEWRSKKEKGVSSEKLLSMKGNLGRRCANICSVLRLERWTQKSRAASEMSLTITWYAGAPVGICPRLPAHVAQRLEPGEWCAGDSDVEEGDVGEDQEDDGLKSDEESDSSSSSSGSSDASSSSTSSTSPGSDVLIVVDDEGVT
ncbi:unnamed protein product [Polarella glacialis]|nr:unnamed protein product [Polarella glacialis]